MVLNEKTVQYMLGETVILYGYYGSKEIAVLYSSPFSSKSAPEYRSYRRRLQLP